MSWKRDADTGLILRKASGLAMCNTCCFVPTFSANNCCCFLDPSPAAYNSNTVYALRQAVSYGGFLWYSLQANNQNHTPVVGGWWAKYTACGNENWDSVPPFGAIGKTPKFYAVSWGYYNNVWAGGSQGCDCVSFDVYQRYYGVLEYSPSVEYNCIWSGVVSGIYYSAYFANNYPVLPRTCTVRREDLAVGGVMELNLNRNGYATFGVPDTQSPFVFTGCTLKGTIITTQNTQYTCGVSTLTKTLSIRPLDCVYTLWNNTNEYTIGDCVSWAGLFWKCCIINGPGTDNGVQEPTGSEVTCTGSNYWRLV